MEAWAQLVCTTDTETPPTELDKDKFTIGRAGGNDIFLAGNKLVSGVHCYIERDASGKVWLYDSSTNGTLLNMTHKLTKGECRQLQHGDEFHVVYKKNNEELNIGYLYQDLQELAREEQEELEGTEEYHHRPNPDATLVDDELNMADSPESKKRPHPSDETTAEPTLKKHKSGDPPTANTTPPATPALDKDQGEDKKIEETAVKDGEKEKGKSEGKAAAEEKSKAEKDAPDEADAMGETLVCIICQEILHDCISLQPCMHSFCSGCYSEWMDRSNECPSCRLKVDRINKNHIVNNLVEAYLKEHPDRKRPEEDIKELDAKNKITRDMLYPKNKRPREEDESSEYSDEDEYDPSPAVVTHVPAPVAGALFGLGNPFFGTARPPKTVCRQCAEFKDPAGGTGLFGGIQTAVTAVKNLVTGAAEGATAEGDNPGPSGAPAAATDGAGPSTGEDGDRADPDVKVMPTPPQFTCAINQNHILCACCMQPMPDRRVQRVHNPAIPAQQCSICYRAYCHAYWGCRNANCLGCLGKFKDMNFGKKCLPNLILDNTSESTIFKDYLEANNISVRDVLKEGLAKLESGQYKCFDQMRGVVDGETYFCYMCGLRNFKDLAYQYRKDIPKENLPEAVQRRSDCYWGKNCRTQRNKPHHAANFNHVCDQTRKT
ncbi:E3 ubiquitin-protein ligase CHFR-like [Haliotis rufescens]|uniref:E3 ubiquitin-protein ligase CHFR-like n=1 Tax=Haliotis rufescens TaxID=6454 RepID=UPI00201F9877|nr:E3 ubiquitin-protein ligase CHFR-like [Haliotis rufescens]